MIYYGSVCDRLGSKDSKLLCGCPAFISDHVHIFRIHGYVRVWIQVKAGSGPLKRPATPALRAVWAPLTVNPSFMAFKSVCVCARTCVSSSSGAEIWQPESDARGSHSEEPCRFPLGIMGVGKQVIAWMAPNFTLLSSGEKGFLLSCRFC